MLPEAPTARVLLVDDKPQNLMALEAILSNLHLDVVKAGSGEEALRYLLKDDFAVILLDVRMPVMDGLQTAGLIRQRERSHYLFAVFNSDQINKYGFRFTPGGLLTGLESKWPCDAPRVGVGDVTAG
jgi:CheY-like chemotaxis protein